MIPAQSFRIQTVFPVIYLTLWRQHSGQCSESSVIIIWKCLIDSFLIVSIVTYFILSFQVCLVKFLWKILSATATLDGNICMYCICMLYYSKCSTYTSLSLKFLLDWSQFLRLFFFLWKSGRRASRLWLFEKNWFYYPQSAGIAGQSVLCPGGREGGEGDRKYNDGLLFSRNHQALSSDQSVTCWRFQLNLIIHHLPADSLPKWNCKTRSGVRGSQSVIMQMQAGWLTSSISRDNGPVLFSNRVFARQSVKYCCKLTRQTQTASFPARPFCQQNIFKLFVGQPVTPHTSHLSGSTTSLVDESFREHDKASSQ